MILRGAVSFMTRPSLAEHERYFEGEVATIMGLEVHAIIIFHMWLLFAVTASILWGMTYVFDEQNYRHLSVPTTLAIHAFAVAVIIALVAAVTGTFQADLATIGSSPR